MKHPYSVLITLTCIVLYTWPQDLKSEYTQQSAYETDVDSLLPAQEATDVTANVKREDGAGSLDTRVRWQGVSFYCSNKAYILLLYGTVGTHTECTVPPCLHRAIMKINGTHVMVHFHWHWKYHR